MIYSKYTLAELATIKYGKDKKKVISKEGHIPIYGTGGFMGYATKALYDKPSVLIGRKGTIGKVKYVEHPFWTVDTLFYTVVNTEIVLPRYLYYAMSLIDLDKYNEGTTIPSLRTETLNKLVLDIPSLEEQQKIISYIRPIEEKIEINQKINKNLQEQAKALYRNMFIDNYSSEWSMGTLSDISDITMGQSPSGDTYNEKEIGMVFYQGRTDFGFRFPKRRIFTAAPKRIAQAGDVLISVRAPVGDLNVSNETCCIGRGLGAIHAKDGKNSFVLYTLFTLQAQLNVFNCEGTVFGSINQNDLKSMPTAIPDPKSIELFESIVEPMDSTIRSNYDEICCLQELRDSLLPKLMSGKFDFKDMGL